MGSINDNLKKENIFLNQPVNNFGGEQLQDLSRCHMICLPDTPTSKAGLESLMNLYSPLINDSQSLVVWIQNSKYKRHLGGFGSGTINYRQTERSVRRFTSFRSFLKIALSNIINPKHILARYKWNDLIPHSKIGYILTLGITSELKANNREFSGRFILKLLEDWFMLNHAQESWVDTELTNLRALNFYNKNGYKEVRRSFSQVLLRKKLDR